MPNERSVIMRQDPVPPGRYWLDVTTDKWLREWQALREREGKALQVDKFEPMADPSVSFDPPQFTELGWYLFFVTAPISWPKGKLARPNTAPSWITTRTDIQQRPEDARKHPLDTSAEVVTEWLDDYVMPGLNVTWRVALIVGAAYVLLSNRSR